jgi:hypothetical protein
MKSVVGNFIDEVAHFILAFGGEAMHAVAIIRAASVPRVFA